MSQKPKNIELQLQDVAVLTTEIAAEIVNGILDFLLFHRSQIPFVYKTYKYYVEKWDENEMENVKESFEDYQLQKQRSQAKDTKEAISNMREVIITNQFKWHFSIEACGSFRLYDLHSEIARLLRVYDFCSAIIPLCPPSHTQYTYHMSPYQNITAVYTLCLKDL